MQKSLRILAAAACILLLSVGEAHSSGLAFSLSTDHSTVTLERKFTLYCKDLSTQSEEDSDSNNMATAPDDRNSYTEMKMQMSGKEEGSNTLLFELNNSVIYTNSTTLLRNFSVQTEDRDGYNVFIASFQLNPYEVFFGNFTCRRNRTVSNDALLAYVPMTILSPSSGTERDPRHSAVVGMGLSLSIMIQIITSLCVCLVVVCCKRRQKKCSDNSELNKTEQLKHADLVSRNHSQARAEGSGQSSWPSDHSAIIHFTANGYAVPKCSRAPQLLGSRKAAELHVEKQSCISNGAANFLSKKAIVKVLKYLLHPSDCSRLNCLCKEVKAEYDALLNEVKPNNYLYRAPLCSVAGEQVERDIVQGRCQTAESLYADNISGSDQPHSCVVTFEEDHSTSCSSLCHKEDCGLATEPCLSSIHYPKLSPATSPVFEVSYVDPLERVTFDCKGGRYINQDHGVGLTVPPGAVPRGDQVTIEIGISLSCPVIFPADTKPVSAMLSMCVVNNPNYTFLKPVQVKLAHYLDITTKEDVNNLEIQFLKSGHNLFCLHKAEGKSTFEPGTHCGILSTNHFCCFCVCANKKKADLAKTNYRLIKVMPNSTVSLRWKARYCITYFLPTCLRALEKQYCPTEHSIQSLQRFKFTNHTSSEQPYIGISFERRVVGGWNLALETPDRIYAKDIDFWELEPSDLEQMETEKLYPPRFMIDVCGTQAHATGQLWVNFSGMAKEFKSELILDASRGLPHCTFPTPSLWADWTVPYRYSFPILPQPVSSFGHHHPQYCSAPCLPEKSSNVTHWSLDTTSKSSGIGSSTGSLSNPPSHDEFMNKVAVEIPTKWRRLGIQLGLQQPQLDWIDQNHALSRDSLSYFDDVYTEWRRRGTSPFTWSTIINALKSQIVGENVLAQKLEEQFEASSSDSNSQFSLK